MAKVPFSKLKCKINEDIKELQLSDDITIEVKQYLPIQEKLKLIGRVVELAHEEDYNYSNPVKANVFTELEMVFAYTNLSFTDKQKEEPSKLYDLLVSSGALGKILITIPLDEVTVICEGVGKSIESIYEYQNSILGVLDSITHNYDYTKVNVEDLNNTVQELSKSPILTELMPLLGQ